MIMLYHHGSSVCAAKVRLVLAEKSVPWDGIYVDILRGDQFDPGYVKLNPKAVVPTLVHDGKVIVESSVICEYLRTGMARRRYIVARRHRHGALCQPARHARHVGNVGRQPPKTHGMVRADEIAAELQTVVARHVSA